MLRIAVYRRDSLIGSLSGRSFANDIDSFSGYLHGVKMIRTDLGLREIMSCTALMGITLAFRRMMGRLYPLTKCVTRRAGSKTGRNPTRLSLASSLP